MVVAVVSSVIGNESENATLQFRIDDAEPRVKLSGLRWFYSYDLEEITSRTGSSRLVTSFSSDGVYFNITIVNILQERRDGEVTDEGRYFLLASNAAGSSMAFVDLEVYGKP